MIKVPPLKIQGIKTKLLPFIKENITYTSDRIWVEPFLGSGAVALNIKPKKAVLSDINPHIIQFYKDIQNKILTHKKVLEYLKEEGAKLQNNGEHYYFIRQRFNQNSNSFDFLFLNRACFNGVMRFNRKGQFNTPFCKKPERFRGAYITKICNQIKNVEEILSQNDWSFVCQDWNKTLENLSSTHYVYLDPPYAGRHADYFSSWKEEDSGALLQWLCSTQASWSYSMWESNQYRTNPQIQLLREKKYIVKNFDHFYHVGGSEKNRGKIVEALVSKE